MKRAVLFKSQERFENFERVLAEHGVETVALEFEKQEWVNFDFSDIAFVIYYPSFKYSSNHPLSLYEVYDNLVHISTEFPHIKMYPDPGIIRFYNDKYRQYLFLRRHNYPIPKTFPLFSEESVQLAEDQLGYPMVVKNRYGAGGGSVFRVSSKKELQNYYNLSTANFFNFGSARYFFNMLKHRIFYYYLIKAKRMSYPFLSPPLLAQKYIKMDRDLKTVVGNYKVVESHWRLQAHEKQWKVNIDDGGIGVWSEVPQEAIDLSVRLARDLKARWLNVDLIPGDSGFLITEFSPVWHHYAYKEKPSFVYKDDYNIDIPLDVSLKLEEMIVESLFQEKVG